MTTKSKINTDDYFNIRINGTEAEYVSVLNSLVIAMMGMDEPSERCIDARKYVAELLLAMLPTEDMVTLKNDSVTINNLN